MTATLSPAPIFEYLAIQDLEAHYDDEPACYKCDTSATVLMIQDCGCNRILMCDGHMEEHYMFIRIALVRGGVVRCKTCGKAWGYETPPEEITRAVSL